MDWSIGVVVVALVMYKQRRIAQKMGAQYLYELKRTRERHSLTLGLSGAKCMME